MANDVDICNMALGHLGSRAQVSAIDGTDSSVEAGHCARYYSTARQELLESSNWTWAMKRAVLGAVANASDVWTFAYAIPSDMLSPMRVLQSATYALLFQRPWDTPLNADEVNLFTERGSALFEIEGQTLFTHEPDAVLLYTRDITDVTRFSASSRVALSYLLASYLAGPIIKGLEGAKVAGQMRQAAARVRGEAAAADANGGVEQAEHMPEALLRRL